ncbi:hypothetical protein B0H19DRAFT_80186 [Mycena capillaripes]|nr:hypothetical protein B0H19DRAFT_80186 [Mycena capillaripes]
MSCSWPGDPSPLALFLALLAHNAALHTSSAVPGLCQPHFVHFSMGPVNPGTYGGFISPTALAFIFVGSPPSAQYASPYYSIFLSLVVYRVFRRHGTTYRASFWGLSGKLINNVRHLVPHAATGSPQVQETLTHRATATCCIRAAAAAPLLRSGLPPIGFESNTYFSQSIRSHAVVAHHLVLMLAQNPTL